MISVISHHVKQSTKDIMIKHPDQGKEDQDLGIGDPSQGRDQDIG